ncbi:hypothetical protein HNR77_001152 [Paenibacillus sp. JGP012]|jgi:hypothetical protein|nr:hypothetical protein [Paenibacillus sp. JGP012]
MLSSVSIPGMIVLIIFLVLVIGLIRRILRR